MRDSERLVLSVRDLSTEYVADEGTVRAVDGVSFEVYSGQTLGIVGESGCGKSVMARSILRILEPPGRIARGEVLFWQDIGNGQEREVDLIQLDASGEAMRSIRGGQISLIFQEPMTSFSPVHTIGDQIAEAIRLHFGANKQEARERVIDLLQMVGVPRPEGRVDEYPFQLSGGLRQRAMIAMALSCGPRLVIADEPTTALDVTTQAQIMDLMRQLQEERGMAMMLITHNMGIIAEMAEDVLVMYLGRQVEYGPVGAIFHAPKHPYTKALLRSIPSIHSTPRERLPTISGSIPHPYNRPSGCLFHPRCSSYMPGRCEQQEPPLIPVGSKHLASCFLYPRV
jgi:peptide/nickel transport system ATP-binding protein